MCLGPLCLPVRVVRPARRDRAPSPPRLEGRQFSCAAEKLVALKTGVNALLLASFVAQRAVLGAAFARGFVVGVLVVFV